VAYWLLKTEPDCYSWGEMVRDKKTVWDGVANALALKNIRSMKVGDEALFYHTGKEKSAVGIVRITSGPYADPQEEDEKLAVMDIQYVRPLEREVQLSEIKADPAFAGWDLLRIGRLSVVPVPARMWDHLLKIAAMGDGDARGEGKAKAGSPGKKKTSRKAMR
jgi:predicted RNA-binding protein with PUA-like domain